MITLRLRVAVAALWIARRRASRHLAPHTRARVPFAPVAGSNAKNMATTIASRAVAATTPRERARARTNPRASSTSRRTRAIADANAEATAEDARELAAWLSYDKGVDASGLVFKEGARGEVEVALRGDVDAGARVLAVPQDCAVTSVDVDAHPIVSGLAKGRPELVGLALWLCAERIKGGASDWAPYVKTLAANPDAPLFWTEAEDFALLKGSPIVNDAVERSRSAREEYAAIVEVIKGDPTAFPAEAYEFFTEERFVDALATVCAKATWLPTASCYALVPLLDVITIAGSPVPGVSPPSAKDGIARCAADYDVDSACVVLSAVVKAPANSRVVQLDPLQRNNGELFLNTGRVDQKHPGDYLYMRTEIQPSDRLFSAKKQVLEGMGFTAENQYFPVYEDRMPTQLYSYLRFARVQDPGEMMAVSFEEDKIVSVMNEYEILQLLMGDCRELMSEYDTNEEDELNLLKLSDTMRVREIEAAKLRMSEKKLIGCTMTAVRKRLAPIRGIPTKQGMEDPNQDLLDIFNAIESIPNKPKEMMEDFKKWARGDYEDIPKGGGGCG